jgi:hypothetical protein
MVLRIALLALLIGLLGSRWDGQPIVAKTIETKLYYTGDATLVVEVARGVLPEDLLGKTMIYGPPEMKGYWQALIYSAEWSGKHIRIMVSPKGGRAPEQGEGAVII